MKPLSGKSALVTGGTRGIGKAITQSLVQNGARVAISYISDTAAAKRLIEELGAENVLAFKSDAGSVEQVDLLVEKVVKAFKQIDILIANAAVSPAEVCE